MLFCIDLSPSLGPCLCYIILPSLSIGIGPKLYCRKSRRELPEILLSLSLGEKEHSSWYMATYHVIDIQEFLQGIHLLLAEEEGIA